ncbi:MAG: HAMP domain-containing histidine kinase [Lachnospiraceae bacterium]|nr:HAMP domain-containing histidine kinase [Lachnospiraceae bacterium]
MKVRSGLPGIRKALYYVMALMLIIWLTLIANVILFVVIAIRYHQETPEYVLGGEVMEALTLTENGYELSVPMQTTLTQMRQWAMLLNEDGEVIWSYRKPVEVKESYTRSEIARMSKWYLEDYPVYLRVWDDQIMVVGIPKHSMWKYNVQCPTPWIDYIKNIWIWIVLFDFSLVLISAFFFTRKWSKNREQVRIEWISGISHDIRTPLSMVMGYSDALQNSENLSVEEKRQMEVIRHQSIVMKELVEDLNLTSRLEYSMQALRVEKLRPAAVLREVAAAFLSDVSEKEADIDMVVSGQAEEIWTEADRQLLIRAFRNLLNNSMQHGEQQETTVIALRMWKERRWCCISFADNGVGYSQELLNQLHSRKKKKIVQNIGGLNIVQKIVLAHGGKIRFENNKHGGSFCEIRLRAYSMKSK